MANNYCQFSGAFGIPAEQKDKAREIIDRIKKEFEKDEDYGRLCCDVEVEEDGAGFLVWLHDDGEYGNPEHAETLARALIEELKPDKPFILSWAFTCSKPRLDEFGGGAFCIIRGKDTFWVDAQNAAGDWADKNK